MKDKIISAVFLVLLGAFGYLLLRLLTFPEPSPKLILAGENVGQMITQKIATGIRSHYKGMKKTGASSRVPVVVSVLKEGERVMEMMRNSEMQFDQALAVRTRQDSLAAHLTIVEAQAENLSKIYQVEVTKSFPKGEVPSLYPIQKELAEIPLLPQALRGLALARVRTTMLLNYERMIEEYSKYI